MAVTTEQYTNQAQASLGTALPNNGTTVDVVLSSGGSAFPSAGNFRIYIEGEWLLAQGRSGNTLQSCLRAQEGSSFAAHGIGASVEHRLSAAGINQGILDRIRNREAGSKVYNIVDYGFVGDGATNNSGVAATLAATVAGTGALILCPAGRYRFNSEVDWYDLPSLKFLALSGKHYQGKDQNLDGGVIFEGWTPGQTLFKVDRPGGNINATHQAPTFDGIGFQDGFSVASKRDIDTVTLVSGTTYRYRTTAAHGRTAGDPVLINGIQLAAEPFGNPLNGHYVISNVSDTTHFDVDIGTTQSLTGLVYTVAQMRYAPTMTLLDLEHETRGRFRDCEFNGGLYGLKFAGGNDVSWANLYGCGFHLNDYGFYLSGEQAQSVELQGGDFQLGVDQVGVEFIGGKAMFRSRGFKMDTVFDDGSSVVGFNLHQAVQYEIQGSFEFDGYGVPIAVGGEGNSSGRIACSFQGNNKGPKGSRVGVGIEVGVSGANATGATTNGSATVTLATINRGDRHTYFQASDVGKLITGTNIPGGATITAVASRTSATISANATGTGSGIAFAWNIGTGSTVANPEVTSEVTIAGSTFTSNGIAIRVGSQCRGVTILGGSTTFCDVGAQIDAGAVGTTLLAFKRHRREASGSDTTFAANHIVDNGTDTQWAFCDNVLAPVGIKLATASSLLMAAAALATTATDGFLYLTSSAGPPTGVPTAATGLVPIHVDTTSSPPRVYLYIGGAWKYVEVS